MKKIIVLSAFALGCASFSRAQEVQEPLPGKNEIHLSITDFAPMSLGFDWKHRINNRMYYRLGLTGMNVRGAGLSGNDQGIFTNFGASAGLITGLEFRHDLGKRFTLFHGPNLQYGLTYLKSGNLTRSIHSTGVNYAFGAMFHATPKFSIGASISHAVSYSFQTNGTPYNNSPGQLTFGLDNFPGRLSFIFKL